jgi:hypothetical protein
LPEAANCRVLKKRAAQSQRSIRTFEGGGLEALINEVMSGVVVDPPHFALIELLFFPKGRSRFEIIHDQSTGIECGGTVRRPDRNQDDRLSRFNGANAMNYQASSRLHL